VPFTAGATGGSAVTIFTATSSPGGFTGTSASSPITVSGLTTGTAYTFTVTATNANGTSLSSASSNSVTPIYSIGTWTASTAYPESVQIVRAVSLTSGALFKNTTNTNSYIWNGSSWSSSYTASSIGGQGLSVARTSATEAQAGNGRFSTSAMRYFNGSSWTSTTNSALGSYEGTGYASMGSNSIRIAGGFFNFGSTYTSDSYYRTGTGAWTQGTSIPVAREYTATDTGTFSKMVFTAWGATEAAYTTTSLSGGWTTITNSPYVFMYWFTLNNTHACAWYYNGSNYVYAILNDNGTYTVIGNAASVGSWQNSGTWGAAAVGTTISQAGGSSAAGAGTLHYTANTI
jgi:hypothetical protein